MTAQRYLPAMDIHHPNEGHDTQYYAAKTAFPTDDSLDQFELFICPYDINHKITSKRWQIHVANCRKLYGGGKTRPCMYNASHHIPLPEWEWHQASCPDQKSIRQDVQGSNSDWKLATKVNHNPDWIRPDTGETWDDEIDDDAPEFVLDPKKGMPLALLPQQPQVKEQEEAYYYEQEEQYEEELYEQEDNTNHALTSVLDEEVIPEKPHNWNDMTKTQKKNYKKRYDRQQKRMQEAGVTEEDFKPETDPARWTANEREAKLKAIIAAYPLAPNKMNSEKTDYTSLLNIVCQKIRLNLPSYTETAPGARGGFAFRCQVRDKFYTGQEYASTKKDAKHYCAKWALLSMEIPNLDGSLARSRSKPVHPRDRTQQENDSLREANEVGRLLAAGKMKRNTLPLRQPKEFSNPPPQQQQQSHAPPPMQDQRPSGLSRMAMHNKGMQERQQQQQQQQQPKQSWGGWGSGTQPTQSLQQQQQQHQQQQQQQRLQQQQQQRLQQQQQHQQQQRTQQWTPQQQQQQQQQQRSQQWAPQQQQQQQQGFSNMANGVGNMRISSEDDFPSLGGGGAGNAWSTVPKKGKGRGSGTTM